MDTTNDNVLGLSDRSLDLIRKFLIGGALVGGGTALGADLLNYLNHINKKNNESDDDTMYVYKDKDQVKAAGLGTGIAIAGGATSGILGAALVHKVYTALRKAQAQKELDNAQRMFLGAQGYKVTKKPKKEEDGEDNNPEEGEKSASELPGKSVGMGETLASMPYAVPILLALATGVVSNKILNDAYPVRKEKVKGPKRIELVNKPTDADGEEKSASYSDGVEFLIRMLDVTKQANSDVRNLIGAVASGRAGEFEKAASDLGGVIPALDTVKGAAESCEDPFRKHLAVSYIAKRAGISQAMGLVAASEFATAFSSMYKLACCQDPEVKDSLFKIACIMGKASRMEISEDLGVRAPAYDVKEASSIPGMDEDAAGDLIGHLLEKAKPVASGDSSESTDTSGEESGISDPDSPSRASKAKIVADSKSSRKLVDGIEPDVIDKILSPS